MNVTNSKINISIQEAKLELDKKTKKLLHDREFLFHLLKPIIKKFEGMSDKQIRNSIADKNKTNGIYIKGLDTEEGSDTKCCVLFDSLFRIHLLNRKNIGILIDIEAQNNTLTKEKTSL